MGESRDKVIKAIKHYQDSLERHSKTKKSDKLLHAIDRLSSLPIRVWHLEETGVGRTVNGLKRYEGEVGESARNLVDKWKSMVKDEEDVELAKQENQQEVEEPVDEADEESLQIAEQPEELEEEVREKTKVISSPKVNNGKKRRRSVETSSDAEQSPKKSKSSDHHKHSKRKQRKKSVSEDSDDSESSEDSTPPRKSHKSKRDSSSDSTSDRSGNDDSDNSDSSHSDSKHRKGKTCSKRSKHSRESKHKDTKKVDRHRSKDKSSSGRSESDRKLKDKSSSKHKDKYDKENASSKERSSSSKSSSSSKHKSSNDKDKSRSSDKDHKKSSSKTEPKEKDKKDSEKNSKKDSSSNKSSKVKVQTSGQLVNGIDSGSGASFADALGMLEAPVPSKSKKKKLVSGEAKASTSTSLTESPKKESGKSYSATAKKNLEVPNLLQSPEELEPLNVNDISSLLPSITPNYRPLGLPVDHPRKGWTDEEALSRVISAKHQRTKVYSGNKSTYTKVPTLFDICSRVLQDNLDALEYTGGVPYSILKPILEKANPNQLYQLEFHNPYLIEDTDELWQLHCQKEFRNERREEMETWRDMYLRCLDEREARLKALTANIKQSQDKSLPVRQTKLAYVDSVVKPPRNIARKQAKNGTAVDIKRPSQTPTERLSQLAKAGEASKVSVPNPGRAAADRSGSSASHSSSNLKPKKAPLMAKTLSLLKNRFGRR